MQCVRFTALATIIFAVVLLAECGSPDVGGPSVGTYGFTGKDANGDSWTATFTLKRANAGYAGTFAWKRNGADAGVEMFTGIYDAKTKNITLTGKQTTGSVVPATYTAIVSSDQSSMAEGHWTTPFGPPGSWRAERMGN